MTRLTRDLAEKLAKTALGHVSREFPNMADCFVFANLDAGRGKKTEWGITVWP